MENDVQLQNIILLIKKTSLETRLGFKKGLFLLLNLKTTSFWSLMKYAKGFKTNDMHNKLAKISFTYKFSK